MSVRNIFLIKPKGNIDIKDVYDQLDKFMKNNRFGIVFEPQNYYDEMLELLECKHNYFTLTNDQASIECEEIFDAFDAFEYAIRFSKHEFNKREKEFLYHKLSFIDKIVRIVFSFENIECIEIYISDQYSMTLDDYSRTINISDGEIVNSLLESYKPTKNDNYFGIKTVKFIIKNFLCDNPKH